MTSPGKAVAMISGGLDSTLALRLVLDQGIEVVAVNFSTGFCRSDHHRQIQRKGEDPRRWRNEALRAGADFQVPVEIIDISQEYLDVVKYPQYGYGKNANPCIDCRIMMMSRARRFMEERGAHFVFTGEVLGQRPKSQHRHALHVIAEQSGLGDRLVRPLSAKLLPPTRPEREGLLDRDRLMAFHGRSRKPQMALAEELGVTEWPQPAGGCCYLTDPGYAVRVFDLFDHGGREKATHADMVLLKVGRHFRVADDAKVIVGRYEEENAFLRNFGGGRPWLEALGHMGPLVVIDGEPRAEVVTAAARLAARYCDGKHEPRVRVRYRRNGDEQILEVAPFSPEECESLLVR